MDEKVMLAEIKSAKDVVADAEGDLARLLGDIEQAARADKTTISEGLRKAFDKLRGAREKLVRLEKLARGQDD